MTRFTRWSWEHPIGTSGGWTQAPSTSVRCRPTERPGPATTRWCPMTSVAVTFWVERFPSVATTYWPVPRVGPAVIIRTVWSTSCADSMTPGPGSSTGRSITRSNPAMVFLVIALVPRWRFLAFPWRLGPKQRPRPSSVPRVPFIFLRIRSFPGPSTSAARSCHRTWPIR